MSQRKKIIFIASFLFTGAMFFLFGIVFNPGVGNAQDHAPIERVVIRDEVGFTEAISMVAKKLTPTVVHIDVSGTAVQRSTDFPFFFGPPQREVPVRALGSGVIISSDGYIITNNHVIQNADTVEVELYDGSRQTADIVGRDSATDLGVIKIRPIPGMQFALLGDSDRLEVGEWVIAIGSPRGLDWTVTAGIVSAKNRSNIGALGPSGYEDFIQTDASINPGNSGGPLINLSGEVVGINSLILSGSRGSDGLGFAIPSNMVKTISESLIKYGKVVRGYMGISIQDITPEMAKNLKLDDSFKGVILADISPDGPTAKAGLEQGDIIFQFNGKIVEGSMQLRNMVAVTKPGTSVKVGVLRNGREMEINVRIGDMERFLKQAKTQPGDELLGLTVEKVTTDVARSAGLRRPTGVVVTRVVPNSPAERTGIEPGDIIFQVGNRRILNSSEFHSLVADAAKQGSVMFLLRDGKSGRIGYILVPLERG